MNRLSLQLLLIIALINSCIELEISAPSFPDIAKHFAVPEYRVGLTITYNLFAFCLASLVYGALSDNFGRRRIMLIGNAILAIGAVACVFAPSINWLLLFRFIQGTGAATSAVVVSAIIADVYNTNKAAKLYGIMNAVFTTLMALAPVLGGFINQAVGWRGNYATVALICIISWILLLLFLPETKKQKESFNLNATLNDFKAILSSTVFISAAAIPSLLYGCYIAFVAIAPFLYMQTYKLDILTYTIHQGIIVAAFALTSFISSSITNMLGVKKSIYLGLFLILISSTMIPVIPSENYLTLMMAVFCIGFAILYPLIFARSMEIFPNKKGVASSLIISIRYLLCSAVTWLANCFYNGSAASFGLINLVLSIIIVSLTSNLIRNKIIYN
ncbi:drug resistance transporter [endosymbiont of Acanthamoeba sp. UWC8]|uniref:multidrug effflux MFS transporter n=1 Tax=endosymbiont of Acanthamoeba sp. UWC8 TaxID=86106 RepID=UPI0004D178F7|nr:multidrug effflux MFS transporter [endosymbiont of Acanthamoeba sp. UWC8]AIF81366.1 drug resistance transporter [endosymbiont of Acanthamoeba sp. UWC8]